jgi:Terpene synthase family 2, C-terminal metal binding
MFVFERDVIDPSRVTAERVALPAFGLVYPRTLNPFADTIVERTVDWVRRFGLASNEEAIEQLRIGRVLDAGPRLVPTAPLEQARAIADWTAYLIILDDEFDGRELGRTPLLAARAIATIVDALREPSRIWHPEPSALARATADLALRFEALAPTIRWFEGFLAQAEAHIGSKVTEAEVRAAGDVLDVREYVELRRVTGAPYTYAYLVELAEQIALPDSIRHTPQWRGVVDAFADVFIAIQDICSCAKEIAQGDTLNLVAVMRHEAQCTLQEAVEEADRWLVRRAGDLERHTGTLRRLTKSNERTAALGRDVCAYTQGLGLLLGGHLAWNSEDNVRYTEGATAPTTSLA